MSLTGKCMVRGDLEKATASDWFGGIYNSQLLSTVLLRTCSCIRKTDVMKNSRFVLFLVD